MIKFTDRNWQVELQCPQCGAPAILEETDQIISCSYCRVKHVVFCRDFFRYFLTPKVKTSNDLFFVPYWRYRGFLFSCSNDGKIDQRVVDTSLRATNASFFPHSLGMRPQTLRLCFVTPSTVGYFCKVNCRREQLLTTFERNSTARKLANAGLTHTSFVGEKLSLIYSPLFVRNDILMDAITDTSIGRLPENALEGLRSAAEDPAGFAPVTFIPTLCPQCGWDLHGERDSLVLLCSNCDSAWEYGEKGLMRLDYAIAPAVEAGPVFLPFWRAQADLEGIELRSRAEFARWAALAGVMGKKAAEDRFHFWVPAFKMNPRSFLKIARAVTLSQPQVNFQTRRQRLSFYPVTLSAKEAAEALHAVLATIAIPRKRIFLRLPEIKVSAIEQLLVYLPFTKKGGEVVSPEMQIGLSSSVLQLGRLI
jgi:hypothetical protein